MSGEERVMETLISMNDLSNQGLTAIDQMIDGQLLGFLVHREGDKLRVWLNVCPHAGRRLDWAPGKFLLDHGRLVCAAHGAVIDLQDGRCIDGPGRGGSLTACAATVEGEFLRVNCAGLDSGG